MHPEPRGSMSTTLPDTWSGPKGSYYHSHGQVQMHSMTPTSSFSTPSPPLAPSLGRDSIASNNTPLRTPTTSSGPVTSSGLSYFSHTPYSDGNSHDRARMTMTAPGALPTQHINPVIFAFSTPTVQHHQTSHYMPDNHEHQFSPFDTAHQTIMYTGRHEPVVAGWTPSPANAITHVNPQLMEATPRRSFSPESDADATFSPLSVSAQETIPVPAAKPNPTSSDQWYDGPSLWIKSVAEAHIKRRATYIASPKAWPKGEGEPKLLQPLTDICRRPHLWEVEMARQDLTEEMVVDRLLRKSQATIRKEIVRCQKANEEFKPPRPMNSAMAFADFRRPQWGEMYTDMKTGAISTWLSAEWRALKEYKPEEHEWWSRVAKRYWDQYVQENDYKFTRAPNGEGKGSKKKKAKAKETAAREKAIRLSAEAARRGCTGARRRGQGNKSDISGFASPMSIALPDHHYPMSLHSSPNTLGLTGLPQLTPTSTTPVGSLHSGPASYFDSFGEASQTPSPHHLLTPLETSNQHAAQSYPQGYVYSTVNQVEFAHQQSPIQHQHHHQLQQPNHPQQHSQQYHFQQQLHSQLPQLQGGSYHQPSATPISLPEDYYHHQVRARQAHVYAQSDNEGLGQGHELTHTLSHPGMLPTLAPNNIPSPS